MEKKETKGLRKRFIEAQEALFGVKKPETTVSNKIIAKEIEQDWGKSPYDSFKDLIDYIYDNALIFHVCTIMKHEILQGGIEVETDSKYNVKIEGLSAKDYLDKFNERINLDEIMAIVCVELVGLGNSFLQIREDGSVSLVPIVAVQKAYPKAKNIPLRDEYDILLLHGYTPAKIPWGEFVHFRANCTSESLPLGKGIVEILIREPDSSTPSVLTQLNKLTEAQTNLALRMGRPTEYISEEGATDEELEEHAKELENMPFDGGRVLSAKKWAVITSMLPRSGLMDQWSQHVTQLVLMVLNSPSLTLAASPGYTFASAEVAAAHHAKTVAYYQRVVKRGVERLWYLALNKSAFDADKANARCRFVKPAEEEDMRKEIKFPSEKAREEPVVEEKEETVEEEAPKTVDINLNIKTEIVPSEPQKILIETVAKTEPVKIETEPLKAEISATLEPIIVKTEPAKVEVELKQPEPSKESSELVQERKKLLKKLSEKLGKTK